MRTTRITLNKDENGNVTAKTEGFEVVEDFLNVMSALAVLVAKHSKGKGYCFYRFQMLLIQMALVAASEMEEHWDSFDINHNGGN